VHLLGFTIEIYYDARSYKCQINVMSCEIRVRRLSISISIEDLKCQILKKCHNI